MPRITGYRLKHESNEYELELDFNDRALMEGRVEVAVVAKHRPLPEGALDGTGPWTKVEATVSYDHVQGTISVSVGGGDPHVINIAKLPGAQTIREFNDSFWTNETGRAVEEIIQAIPVPDPFIGCLLKAGISVTIGQSITCINETRERDLPLGARLRAVLACLGRNAPSMLSRAAGRTLLCWMRLGF